MLWIHLELTSLKERKGGEERLQVFTPWAAAEREVKRGSGFGDSLFIGLPRWADIEYIAAFCQINLTDGRRSGR